jgi:hypothetical protein
VWGLRQEFRFSLYGKTPEAAVQSILHLFETDLSPLDAFAAVPEGLSWHLHEMSYEELAQLIEARFEMADAVHRAVFYGRDSAAPPSPWAFPVLADLANTLGYHLGQR